MKFCLEVSEKWKLFKSFSYSASGEGWENIVFTSAMSWSLASVCDLIWWPGCSCGVAQARQRDVQHVPHHNASGMPCVWQFSLWNNQYVMTSSCQVIKVEMWQTWFNEKLNRYKYWKIYLRELIWSRKIKILLYNNN